MPCDYSKYHPQWKFIRLDILCRAKNRCELCNAENYKPHWKTGSKVVLTIHHIDYDIRNNKPHNLIALCQRCHNKLDMPLRIRNRNKTPNPKDMDKVSDRISALFEKEIAFTKIRCVDCGEDISQGRHNKMKALGLQLAKAREGLNRLSIPLAPDAGNENEYRAWGRQELINIINAKADIAKSALKELSK